jgi:hypothetical protein
MKLDRQQISVPEPEALALQLAVGRTAAGTALLVAPVFGLRLLGADSATAKRVTFVTRMMAIRDAAIGAGALAAARGRGSLLPWIVAGAASDAVDMVVLTQALREGRAKGITARLTVPLSAGAAAVGLITAVRLRGRS